MCSVLTEQMYILKCKPGHPEPPLVGKTGTHDHQHTLVSSLVMLCRVSGALLWVFQPHVLSSVILSRGVVRRRISQFLCTKFVRIHLPASFSCHYTLASQYHQQPCLASLPPFSSHHSGTVWSSFLLPKEFCSRTGLAASDVLWPSLIWPVCFWGWFMDCTLRWPLCIYGTPSFSNCRFSFSYHFHYLYDGFFVFFQPKGGSILLTWHIQMQMPRLESVPDLTA